MNLEKLFDAMDEEIVIVNKSGRIVFCNQAYADQKGRSGRDLKGLCVTELCEGPLIFPCFRLGMHVHRFIKMPALKRALFVYIR